jgi:hypothetical protein
VKRWGLLLSCAFVAIGCMVAASTSVHSKSAVFIEGPGPMIIKNLAYTEGPGPLAPMDAF